MLISRPLIDDWMTETQSPAMTTILSAKGMIEIPEEFRTADALKAGQRCDIERLGHGEYRVRMADEPQPMQSWVEWLLACPKKGWFVERDRSERTPWKHHALKRTTAFPLPSFTLSKSVAASSFCPCRLPG